MTWCLILASRASCFRSSMDLDPKRVRCVTDGVVLVIGSFSISSLHLSITLLGPMQCGNLAILQNDTLLFFIMFGNLRNETRERFWIGHLTNHSSVIVTLFGSLLNVLLVVHRCFVSRFYVG